MLKGFRVDCVTQLLFDSAQTWWDRIQERRTTEILLWVDFKVELRIYTTPDNTIRVKFLALKQRDMIVLEYER